jgi:hypothetical protein
MFLLDMFNMLRAHINIYYMWFMFMHLSRDMLRKRNYKMLNT